MGKSLLSETVLWEARLWVPLAQKPDLNPPSCSPRWLRPLSWGMGGFKTMIQKLVRDGAYIENCIRNLATVSWWVFLLLSFHFFQSDVRNETQDKDIVYREQNRKKETMHGVLSGAKLSKELRWDILVKVRPVRWDTSKRKENEPTVCNTCLRWFLRIKNRNWSRLTCLHFHCRFKWTHQLQRLASLPIQWHMLCTSPETGARFSDCCSSL